METKRRGAVGGAALISLTMLIVVLPFGAGFPLTDEPYPHYRAVPWLDIAFAALIATAVPVLLAQIRRRRVGPGAALWGVTVVLLALSLLVHPSVLGAQALLRAAGILAAAVVLRELTDAHRALVLGSLAAVAVFELAVATAQIVTGGPTDVIGVAPGLSPIRGNVMVGRGTMLQEYVFAGFGLVSAGLFIWHGLAARRGLPWLALAGLAIASVGVTFSRTALLGYAAGGLSLAWAARSSRLHRWALVALLVGGLAPALVLRDGWLGRAQEGAGASQQAVTERSGLATQALTLTLEHPIFGVGTGSYVAAARARFPDEPGTHAVHNVPLFIAAEAGIPAGLAAVMLGIVLGWRALRAGPASLALYLMFVPAMLLDIYPYITAQGAVLTGLWIGGLDAASARARSGGPA